MKSKPQRKNANIAAAKPAEPDRSRTGWWLHAVVVFGLLLANVALYSRTFRLGFLAVDDPDYILDNPWIDSFRGVNLQHIFTEPYAANYAPATILSYALDVALAGGKSAFAVHLSNVLWHGWVACMVYLLAFTIRAEIITAAAAALLFLLHPAHVEVVAWVSSRKDLVATGFAALSMTCYLLSRRRLERRAWWYAASLLGFLVASAAKQSVLLLPAVMLAWDVLVESRRSWWMLADKVPFGLITIFFGWMTWQAQPSTNQPWQPFVLAATQFVNLWLLTGFGQYALYRTAPNPAAWGQFARLAITFAAPLIWALPLLLPNIRARLFLQPAEPEGARPLAQLDETVGRLQENPRRSSFRAWLRPRTGALLHAPTAAGSYWTLITDHSVSAVLVCWVLIQMVPPMLLRFMVPITDRYLFLPSVGACILVASGVAALARRWPGARWIAWAMLGGVATVWAAKTSNYIDEWRDPRSVWYGAHFKTKNPQVSQFLGEIYQNAGERVDDFIKAGVPLNFTNEFALAQAVLADSARSDLLRAEWLDTMPGRTNSTAYRDLLWTLAWAQYQEAVANRGTLTAPNLFMDRGRLLTRQGKADRAIPEFQTALAFAQSSHYDVTRNEFTTHSLYAIGVAYWNLRNYKEAEQWLLKAQEAQRKSGHIWVPTLDREVERLKPMAARQQ